MNFQRFLNRNYFILGIAVFTVATVLFVSTRLQKQSAITSSQAMDIGNIQMPKINTNIQIGISPIPTIAINIPQVNTTIQTDNVSIPDLSSYASQGFDFFKQFLSNPAARQIITQLFCTPATTTTTPANNQNPDNQTDQPPQQSNPPTAPANPTAAPEPQVQLKTCKEGDGTKVNTCPARYVEGNKIVYRQCGGSGWCNYTCFQSGSPQNQTPCWEGQPVLCNNLPCSCTDTNNIVQKCPHVYPEEGKEVVRACDQSSRWCNYTCFKPGSSEVINCWPGQHTMATPTPGAVTQPQPTGSSSPTTAPAAQGKCLAVPPGAAALVGCSTQSYTINSGATSACTTCAGVTAKATCTCPSGTCTCNIPASQPPTTATCTNGGKLNIAVCN